MAYEIKKVDGPRREFSTGAHKQAAAGKGCPVQVPGDAVMEVAKHFENGAVIHGARNWEKGLPLSELLNSMERHLQQEKMGMTDEPHARAMAWNALVYLATKLRIEKGILPQILADMPMYESREPTMDELVAEIPDGTVVPVRDVEKGIQKTDLTTEKLDGVSVDMATELAKLTLTKMPKLSAGEPIPCDQQCGECDIKCHEPIVLPDENKVVSESEESDDVNSERDTDDPLRRWYCRKDGCYTKGLPNQPNDKYGFRCPSHPVKKGA